MSLMDADLNSENKDLADFLTTLGNYYKISNDKYRSGTFYKASKIVSDYPRPISSGFDISNYPGVGTSVVSEINEFLSTGTSKRLRDLETKYADKRDIIEGFRSIYGIGPVKALDLYNKGLRSLDDIWFHGNLNESQKKGIIWKDHIDLPIPREEMTVIEYFICQALKPLQEQYNFKWDIAGSYRRKEPFSGDIDLLIEQVSDISMDLILSYLSNIIVETLAKGNTKFMGILRLNENNNGHRIDIRLVKSSSYSAALMYFTGSQVFNILMRSRANELNLVLNEYGLFDHNSVSLPIESETDIFNYLNIQYLYPHERIRDLQYLNIMQ